MPSLVLTGWPCVGKTAFAKLLSEHAIEHKSGLIKSYVIINEELVRPDKTKAECYKTPTEEKITRSALKAEFERQCSGYNNENRLVILDSMNYIKGYRYELHCISKAARKKHGVIWLICPSNLAKSWNDTRCNKYEKIIGVGEETMNDIMCRFEPPDQRNRWDRPLYRVDVASTLMDDEVMFDYKKISFEESFLRKTSKETLGKSVYNMHSLSDTFNNPIQDFLTLARNNGQCNADNKEKSSKNTSLHVSCKSNYLLSNSDSVHDISSLLTIGGHKACDRNGSEFDSSNFSSSDKLALCEPRSSFGHFYNLTNITTNKLRMNSFSSNCVPVSCGESFHLDSKFNYVRKNHTSTSNLDSSIHTFYEQSNKRPYKVDVICKKLLSNTKSIELTNREMRKMDTIIGELLNSFLLNVEPLKESMSTKKHIPNCSDVLHDVGRITQFVVSSLFHAQKIGGSDRIRNEFGNTLSISLPFVYNNLTKSCGSDDSTTYLSIYFPKSLTFSELSWHRRDYIKWITSQPLIDTSYKEIALSFLAYIENKVKLLK